MFQDKVKQIIDRVKSNEVRYRDKHQSHKTEIAQVHREVIFSKSRPLYNILILEVN